MTEDMTKTQWAYELADRFGVRWGNNDDKMGRWFRSIRRTFPGLQEAELIKAIEYGEKIYDDSRLAPPTLRHLCDWIRKYRTNYGSRLANLNGCELCRDGWITWNEPDGWRRIVVPCTCKRGAKHMAEKYPHSAKIKKMQAEAIAQIAQEKRELAEMPEVTSADLKKVMTDMVKNHNAVEGG